MLNKTSLKFAFVALLFFVTSGIAQDPLNQDIPTLSYSALMKNKEQYFGKIVRVKAVWVYSFERGMFCELKCKASELAVSVYFVRGDDLCEGSKEKLKKAYKIEGKVSEVTFVGTFFAGNLGIRPGLYPYQFEVNCVEQISRVRKYPEPPKVEKPTEVELPRIKKTFF